MSRTKYTLNVPELDAWRAEHKRTYPLHGFTFAAWVRAQVNRAVARHALEDLKQAMIGKETKR